MAAPPTELTAAMSVLDTELARTPERRERWRELLRTDELEKLVKAEESDIDVRDIESIRRVYLGTESPPNQQLLNDARDALKEWMNNSVDSLDNELRDQANSSIYDLFRSFTPTPRRHWDSILGINDALSEFRGEDADKEVVGKTLAAMVAESNSRDRTSFVNVRRALGHWVTDVEDPVTDPLAVLARKSKSTFRPVESWRADQALNEFRQHLQIMDRYLRNDAEWKRVGWEQHLEIEKLRRELSQPRDARLSVLTQILGRFDSGALGLQRPAFRNTRDSLQQYLELLRMTEGNEVRITESRERLDMALKLLDQFLVKGGERKEIGWKQFLQWDSLTTELSKSNPDNRTLREIVRVFESAEPGLQTLPFRLAARRLEKYVELRLIERSTTKPVDIFDDKLDSLARLLEAHSRLQTAITASDISLQTKWLAATGQATDLVQKIAGQYSRENVFGSVSGDLISDRLKNVVTDSTPINRMFEEVHIHGTANTRAQVRGQLVPSLDSAILDILLSGTTDTSTVGQRRRVSVYSTGTTWLSGRKRLMFDLVNGVQTLPATASANTHQQINNVHVDRLLGQRFISRIATRKAWESVPKAKSMANDEARQTIARQMDENADSMLGDANRQLKDKLKSPLRERGFRPEMFHVSSSSTHVEMRAQLTPHDYFGAPVEPPVWNRDHDIAVCLHESALNNSLAGFFGGIRIDNENIIKILELYGLDVPEELQVAEDHDRPEELWSMTFDLHHPISISIGINRIHARVMGMEFEQNDTKIKERIRIGASYMVHWKPKQLPVIERDGDVEVEFIDSPDKLSTRQLTTKTFLLRKVGALFKDKIDLSEMDTAEATELLQSLTLRKASLYKGWFAAALDVDADALPRR